MSGDVRFAVELSQYRKSSIRGRPPLDDRRPRLLVEVERPSDVDLLGDLDGLTYFASEAADGEEPADPQSYRWAVDQLRARSELQEKWLILSGAIGDISCGIPPYLPGRSIGCLPHLARNGSCKDHAWRGDKHPGQPFPRSVGDQRQHEARSLQ